MAGISQKGRMPVMKQHDEVSHIEETLYSGILSLTDFEHVAIDCICSGKFCPHCKRQKCRGDFGSNRAQKDGLQPNCRTCRALISKKPRAELHVEAHIIANCACRGKRCPICQQVKCDGEFYHTNQSKRGLSSYCRICHNIKMKERKQTSKYKAQQREYSKRRRNTDANGEYNSRDPEERRNYNKLYRETHADKIKSRFKIWYQNHREYSRERGRLYRQRHPEKDRERSRTYQQTHREACRERKRAWSRSNPERKAASEAKRRARKLQAGGSFTVQQWTDLKEAYNFTCLWCGRQEPQIKLTSDHVIPLAKGGCNDISNIQPLCGPCNSKKNARMIDFRLPKVFS
jgi:hypothetical protein